MPFLTPRRWANLGAVVVAVGLIAALLAVRNNTGGGLLERRFRGPNAAGKPFETRTARRLVFRSTPGKTSVTWKGTLLAPAAGRYILALYGRGRGRIEVGARTVVTLTPSLKMRRARGGTHLERGPHPIRIRFSGDHVSVRWKPPVGAVGLQGMFHQYLPSEVLFPGPPSRAPEAPSSTAPRRDGWFALGCVAILLAMFVFLGRHVWSELADRWRTDAGWRREVLLVSGVAGAALVLANWGLMAGGECNDEALLWGLGRDHVRDLLSLDFSRSTWSVDTHHPPLTKYFLGLGGLFTEDVSGSRRITALLAAPTTVLVYLAARRLATDRAAPILAAALFVLFPHALAHHRTAGHEALLLFLGTLSVYAFIRGLQDERHRWILLAAVTWGMGLAARQNSATWAVIYLVAFVTLRWRTYRGWIPRVPWPVLLLPVIAVAVFVAAWPFLWTGAAQWVTQTAERWKALSLGDEWFLGTFHHRMPATYLWVYAAVTAPLVHLVGFACFLIRGAVRERAALAVVGVWFVAPLLTGLGPVVQDGIRYASPSFAPMCIAAGIGLVALGRWLAGRVRSPGRRRALVAGLATLVVLPLIVQVGLYFPYYHDYYNELLGPQRAFREKLFEVGWWCEGLQPAMRVVNHLAPKGSSVQVQSRFCHHVRGLRPDLRIVGRTRRGGHLANFVIRNYLLLPKGPPPGAGYRRVHVEEVLGAPLTEVWQRGTR